MGNFIVNETACLNYNYKKNGCRLCREICPQSCWNAAGRIETDSCDGCGLCQAACPADAIGVEGISAAAWNEQTRKNDRARHFSCLRYGEGPWSCLGFLTARDMIALTLAGGETGGCDIFIHDTKCQQCKPPIAAHLEREIAVARAFVSAQGNPRIFNGAIVEKNKIVVRKIDRRSFFSSLLKTGAQTARNVIWPEDAVTPLTKVVWRVQALQGISLRQAEQSAFPVLSVASGCAACGLCAKICPTKALQAHATDSSLQLSHTPLACSGCGLCIEHCPEGAIAVEQSGSNLPYLLICKNFPTCNECGNAFQPAGKQLTCFDCLMKGSRSVFEP